MEDRIKKVMSDVFNVDVSLINNESSPDNIENWDSLKHMNLIVALEEEFEIEFDDEEIVDSMNFALIVNILKSK
ncbi:MAG: acyl carrier protein [Bacteriovoracaceae bacterium]|nr:acyl carrier protein [Bacteroidota bacterium]MBL6992112.1 acyl carrier protein [Bacteriovoracaceae bacterium]